MDIYVELAEFSGIENEAQLTKANINAAVMSILGGGFRVGDGGVAGVLYKLIEDGLAMKFRELRRATKEKGNK